VSICRFIVFATFASNQQKKRAITCRVFENANAFFSLLFFWKQKEVGGFLLISWVQI